MSESNFGPRLKELREQAGLTQPQLAERAGMSKGGLADLEQGRYVPSWPIVQALCAALGVECTAFNQAPAARDDVKPGRPTKKPADDVPVEEPEQGKVAGEKAAKKRKGK